MKFRFHKGGLDEAMATMIEVDSKEELMHHIHNYYFHEVAFNHKLLDIKFEFASFDKRTNWDTFYVVGTFENWGEPFCVGMSDAEFKI